jgi:hypothetical protein
MAQALYTNNAFSTLASGITDVATTITVAAADGALFPSPTGTDYFYATLIDTSNNLEIVKCTTRSTDTLTVVRGAESTVARAYSSGDRIELRVTAAGLTENLAAVVAAQTAAEAAQTAAEAAQTATEAVYDSFDDRYLGSKASAPALDNDSNALIDGALYFDTTANDMYVYDLGNTTWVTVSNSATSVAAAASEAAAAASESAAAASAATASAAASGIFWKAPVATASTANLTLSGEQTIDGVLTSTSRVLVKNQTAPAENGVYVTAAGAWARSTPLDTWDEHVGAAVIISQGSTQADTAYLCTVDAGGTLGTTDVTWTLFGSGGLTAGNNLSDVSSAATSFSNIKQAASETATGVVELATAAEVATGSDTARAVTPAGAAAHYSPITRVTNDDTSTALTAALTDAGNVVFMNNAAANVFTIPANATVAFAVDTQIDIVMEGAGVTTITADTGVTLNGVSAGSGAISAQYSAVTIIKRATDTWIMFGNHAAVA